MKVKKDHPYLLITTGDNPGLQHVRKLQEKATRYPALWKPILKRAERDCETDPYFPENPNGWLGDAVERVKERVFRDAMAYLVTEDERFLKACKAQLWSIIDEWPWLENVKRSKGDLFADLRTGAIMYTLGLAYDWLYQVLNEEERERLRQAIRRGNRMLMEDIRHDAFYLKEYGNNWLVAMLGTYSVAALATYHEIDEAPLVMELAFERCLKLKERIGDDGGWEEGASYWAGAVENLSRIFAILYDATGGVVNELDSPKLSETGYFPLYMAMAPDGRADFSDAYYSYDHGGAQIYAMLAARTENPHYQWAFWEYRNVANEEAQRSRGIREIRPVEEVYQFISYDPRIPEQPPSASFPLGRCFQSDDYAFVSSRNGWGREDDGLVIVGKGGNNGTNHHHLDVGQIIASAFGERYLKDLGYSIPTRSFEEDVKKNSFGHNIVIINGQSQIDDASARGIIREFETDNSKGDAYIIDCTSAYGDICRKAERTVVHLRPDILVVLDDFELTSSAEVSLRWHYDGQGSVDAEGNLTIQGAHGICTARLYCATGVAHYQQGEHAILDAYTKTGERLPDEIHSYIELQAAAGRKHQLISIFHFDKGEATSEQWERQNHQFTKRTARGDVKVSCWLDDAIGKIEVSEPARGIVIKK